MLNDISRCIGTLPNSHSCDERETCERHTDLRNNHTERISLTQNLKNSNNEKCKSKIEVKNDSKI